MPPGPARVASLRTFRQPGSREVIDRGLSVWFPAPASYTGEDMLELHHHGGEAVAAALLAAVRGISGIELAEPGDFTRRAFLAGKLDLTQVEAVADLIDASTQAQARQAMRQLDGELSRACAHWQQGILEALVLAEAEIDFSDQEVPDQLGAIRAILRTVHTAIELALAGARAGERLREGVVVAVTGAPNSGKSSLVNRLAGRDVSIVTQYPGTTRDVLEVPLELDGLPVLLLDTAGVRETDDPVELAGIQRARARAASAEIRLLVIDATAPEWPAEPGDSLTVVNKIDLSGPPTGWSGPSVSCATGRGIEALSQELAERTRKFTGGGEALINRERQRQQLERASAAIGNVLHQDAPADLAIVAEELRYALVAFDRLCGRTSIEDILDQVFARFCLGK